LLDQRADVTIVNGNVAFSTGAVVAAAGHQLGQDPVSEHQPENRLTRQSELRVTVRSLRVSSSERACPPA
jgi:hypothetical protein